MDISSILNSYTSQTSTTQSATSNTISNLNSSSLQNASDDELMSACKEFESYFLEQMFKEMKKTVPKSEDTSAATSSMLDYFEEELMQQYAKDATETETLGLAQMLFEQMKRNYM